MKRSLYKFCPLIVVVFCFSCLNVDATEDEEKVIFIQRAALYGAAEKLTEKPVLTRLLSETAPIKFISEKTKFSWGQHDINYKKNHSTFLEKLDELKLNGANYNHLCLVLYAICEDESGLVEVTEYPLFAKASEMLSSLGSEGHVKNAESIDFYTIGNQGSGEKWAYFTSPDSETDQVINDPTIFPVSSTHYQCDSIECNAVCNELYHETSMCNDPKEKCRHTEPNALYHVRKNIHKLLKTVIADKGKKIKSVGVRYFSFCEPCSSCTDMLNQNRSIEINGEQFSLGVIFYFIRNYDAHLTKMRFKKGCEYYDLVKTNCNYFSFGILCGSKIFNFNEEGRIPEPTVENIEGWIKLEESIDLASEEKILLVPYYTNSSSCKDLESNKRIKGNVDPFKIYY
jgi:hypothetical protein